MRTPMMTIDLAKIENNARAVAALCSRYGVTLTGVTKGTLGMPEVAEAMLRGGARWIGESRILNIQRLKAAGINAPFLLMRSPHLSEADAIVEAADVSLNTDLTVIRALSAAAEKQGKVHQIILMVDLGDLREGFWPEEVPEAVGEILKLRGIELVGMGTNLTDLNGTIPTLENNLQLVALAETVEARYGCTLRYLSAGNSSSLNLLASGQLPARINHFRVGEGILLGRETVGREALPGTCQDAFTLTAEVIESRWKPSVPVGELGQDAFGNTPQVTDKGMMIRSLLNIGRQDVVAEGLMPRKSGIAFIGATSDHLVLDTTAAPETAVGDTVDFDVTYGAMLSAMTSPYVTKYVKL